MPFHPGLNFKGVCWSLGSDAGGEKIRHDCRACWAVVYVCVSAFLCVFLFFFNQTYKWGFWIHTFISSLFFPLPCTSDFSISCLYLIFLLFLIFKHLPFQSSFRSEVLPHQTMSLLLCESYYTSCVILLLLYFTLIFHPIGIVCCFKRHPEDERTLRFWELCSVETENTATYLSPHQNSWMKPHKHGERSPIMFAMLVVKEGRS